MRTSAVVDSAVTTPTRAAARGQHEAFRAAMLEAARPTPAPLKAPEPEPDGRPGDVKPGPAQVTLRPEVRHEDLETGPAHVTLRPDVRQRDVTPTPRADAPFAGLRLGDTDAINAGRVSQVQKVLQRWNPRLEVGSPGTFDARTADALTLYKAIYGSGKDGRSIDPQTARNLRAMQDGTFWRNPPAKTPAGELLYHASRALGKPYRMGGDGQAATDCGMLTRVALIQAGHANADFSRMADQQYHYAEQGAKGLQLRSGAPQPGDLVFFDNPTSQSGSAYAGVTHVGIYVGDQRILAASSGRGQVVLQSLDGLNRYVKGYARVAPPEVAGAP